MEEIESIMKHSIEHLLESILRSKSGSNSSIIDAATECPASAEEGVRLIHAFICVTQPELRAAIIEVVTQLADVRALTMPVVN
jgi:S-ribosylhomocysteine lyase LuxS involved in autoinducer biosynthesis